MKRYSLSQHAPDGVHASLCSAARTLAPLAGWRSAILLPLILLSGCASLSADGGYTDLASLTSQRLGQPVQLQRDAAPAQQVQALLAKPLTADAAVQLALLNNSGLKASLTELGIAEAELVQAGRLRNPAFSFGRVRGGGETEIDRSVMFDLAGLITMPQRRRMEQHRFEQTKYSLANRALQLASDTRIAYFTAVAAAQSQEFAEQVALAAQASGQLAERMAKAGNWSRLDQAREQAFQHDATTQLVRARHEALVSRETLLRLLGIDSKDATLQLPARLPELPHHALAMPDAEAQALSSRLDVLAARQASEASAEALGLSQTSSFVNVFELGYADKRSTGSPRQQGYEVTLELPIFDWGSARNAAAQASYMQTVHHAADVALQARSQVRVAYSAYQSQYEIARHYQDNVVPLRKQIADEVLLRYNGMLASVFELLADAREQLTAVNGAITSQRDFWIAETSLQAAIHGGSNESRSQP
ncbi:TolC family protein [Pseudoduganella danionis]|uniref:TolC family protein n=1 Tax=Pseudoduganella danionis TaxID=1890295 RepID=UPI0035B3C744